MLERQKLDSLAEKRYSLEEKRANLGFIKKVTEEKLGILKKRGDVNAEALRIDLIRLWGKFSRSKNLVAAMLAELLSAGKRNASAEEIGKAEKELKAADEQAQAVYLELIKFALDKPGIILDPSIPPY